jgi:hypothetical protein
MVSAALGLISSAQAATTTFFHGWQSATNTAAGSTTDTIRCGSYLFTYTRDKWWYPTITLGPGTPTGRPVRVSWPAGVEAQSPTADWYGLSTNQVRAKITIKRFDNGLFDLTQFSARLLANTAGAGARFEIMPKLDGEDKLGDPAMFEATGFGGQTFSYAPTNLTAADTYEITLYVDFALTALTLVDELPPSAPRLTIGKVGPDLIRLTWPDDGNNYHLQGAPDLDPTNFVDTGDQPVRAGDYFTVTVPAQGEAAMYRLAY